MTINGTVPITTYFILGKKDRAGKGQQRPFQAVLEAMKKQDTEEAKIKQSANLKGGLIAPPAPIPTPAPTFNGNAHPQLQPQPPPPPHVEHHPMPTQSVEIPVPVKTVRNDVVPPNPAARPTTNEDNYMRQSEVMSEHNDPTKSHHPQQPQSKTCELL
jgi:hypothetical protein